MNFQEAFINGLAVLWAKIAAFTPNLAAGILILLLGYLASRFLASITRTILRKLAIDRVGENSSVKGMLEASGMDIRPSDIIAKTVFLFSMLIFVVTAADSVGLNAISSTIDSFILFLPKVVAALIIALLGLYFAQLLRDAVQKMTEGFGIEYAQPLAATAHGLTVLVVVILAVNQLEIDTGLLQIIIGIVLTVAGLAAAIALGFGSQRVAQNIVSGVYARDVLRPGSKIHWDGTDGVVIEVGSVSTLVEIENKRRLHVPNGTLIDQVFEIRE